MIFASYELNNFWHGLGHVGHIVLAVLGAVALIVVAALIVSRR